MKVVYDDDDLSRKKESGCNQGSVVCFTAIKNEYKFIVITVCDIVNYYILTKNRKRIIIVYLIVVLVAPLLLSPVDGKDDAG